MEQIRVYARWLVGSLACLAIATIADMPMARSQPLSGTVVRTGDGDDITVRTPQGNLLKVRLACIDTPELAQAPFGRAATTRLQQLLPVGSTVTVRVADVDRYQRSVGEVYYNNRSINLQLVREGHAAVYRRYLQSCPATREQYLTAENQAKQQRLGFWQQASPVMPWEFRRRQRSQR